MKKRIYISADYSLSDGDREVVEVLHGWSDNDHLIVNFTDTSQVVSGSVSKNPDCRYCDLKREFNKQINVSSIVLFVIGDKTAARTAGSLCRRMTDGASCLCTPYKQNANGSSYCKYPNVCKADPDGDIGYINNFSYLEHEFREAKKLKKQIVIVYNAINRQPTWLPAYMSGYEDIAIPFWKSNSWYGKSGNYELIKQQLGF